MIKNLFVRNKQLSIFIIIVAIIIPIVVFSLTFVYKKSNNVGNITPSPIVDLPIPESNEKTVYEFELVIGLPTSIPETNIELELVSTISQQEEGCFDCIASTIVEMRREGEAKIWDYSCGGFSGECNYQFNEFGYVVEAQELRDESMVVKIYSN